MISIKKRSSSFKYLVILLLGLTVVLVSFNRPEEIHVEDELTIENEANDNVLSHIVDLKKHRLKLYWKNKAGERYGNFEKLKNQLEKEGEELVFAMNGGMYQEDGTPLGLYIEDGEQKHRINNVQEAYGNFYMQPNGVFYISDKHTGHVCKTTDFSSKGVKYATQSGPMLLIDGKMHPKFNQGSTNLNIRNGIGVLPNGNLVFVMSKGMINFYDFASYFQSLGCQNALYLDGFVSRTYLPSKNWNAMDGNFGVIIGQATTSN